MFGLLRMHGCGDAGQRYRQVYAALCAYHRREYGQRAGIFHSYEAVFLYHLAVDEGACPPPDESTPRCCRFRSDRGNRWRLDESLAQFCSAFAMLLTGVKLEDDLRDNPSITSRLLERVYRKPYAKAKRVLDDGTPGLTAKVSKLIEDHLAMEGTGKERTLTEYVKPTASAFGELFAAFGNLLRQRGVRKDVASLGQLLGSAIIAADCGFDYERDQRKSEYNPLRSRNDTRYAFEFAGRNLAQAGWQCFDTNPQGVCSQILRRNFQRVMEASTAPASDSRQAAARRGDCDCICPLDLCGGCAGDCGGCGECGGGCGGGDLVGGCCCDPTCLGCDPVCCECGGRKQRRRPASTDTPHSINPTPDDSTQQTGLALGPLDPFGIVSIQGQHLPARSSTLIAPNQPVATISANPYGLVVRGLEAN